MSEEHVSACAIQHAWHAALQKNDFHGAKMYQLLHLLAWGQVRGII